MNKSPREIISELHTKFCDNFVSWTRLQEPGLDRVFTGLYCISAVGEILSSQKTSKHHEICCKIYDEIFADGASSIYLATIAMDKPASVVLRRILELGVAAVYLWDMPHMAFAWNQHDGDLSFSEMISHLNSKGFAAYVSEATSSGKALVELIPSTDAQKIYGKLSDVVHGKISTFETTVSDRFNFNEKDWKEFVLLAEQVIYLLLNMFVQRYAIKAEILAKVPQAKNDLK